MKLKKGNKVKYLGHPATITNVKDYNGKTYYSVSYNKGSGKTKASSILSTDGSITELNEFEGKPIPMDTPNAFAYLDFKKYVYKNRGMFKKEMMKHVRKSDGQSDSSRMFRTLSALWFKWAYHKAREFRHIKNDQKFGRALMVLMVQDDLIFDKKAWKKDNNMTHVKEDNINEVRFDYDRARDVIESEYNWNNVESEGRDETRFDFKGGRDSMWISSKGKVRGNIPRNPGLRRAIKDLGIKEGKLTEAKSKSQKQLDILFKLSIAANVKHGEDRLYKLSQAWESWNVDNDDQYDDLVDPLFAAIELVQDAGEPGKNNVVKDKEYYSYIKSADKLLKQFNKDVKKAKILHKEGVNEGKLTEALARGLKPLLQVGTTINKNAGEAALVKLSDKFDRIDDEVAEDVASYLNMAIERMQDGYAGQATRALKAFNKACKDALSGKSIKSAFEGVNESTVNEAKVSYNFSEEELKRVLQVLGRNASTEVKIIKAFETALGRKLTRDELFEVVKEDKLNESMIGIETKADFKPNSLKGELERAGIKGFKMDRLTWSLSMLKLDKKDLEKAKKIIDTLPKAKIKMVKESVNEAKIMKGDIIKMDDGEYGVVNKVKGKVAYIKLPSMPGSFHPIEADRITYKGKHKGKDLYSEIMDYTGAGGAPKTEATDLWKRFDAMQRLQGDMMDAENDMMNITATLKQIHKNMEQEAEPEGGKIADKYGKQLDKYEKMYKKRKIEFKKLLAKLEKMEQY